MQANKDQFSLVKQQFALPEFMRAIRNVVPTHQTAERMVRIALDAINRNPLLLQCSTPSLMRSVLDAGQLGLEPSSVLGLAYLVPYRNKSGGYDCQLIPGFQGLIDLATRSNRVLKVEPGVIYDFDEYEFERGSKAHIQHKPAPWPEGIVDVKTGEPDITHIVAFYAVATLANGATQFEWMWKSQVDAVKAMSKAPNGPWSTFYTAMGLKTPIRRLCKYIPKSVELMHALEIEDRAEGFGDVMDMPASEFVGESEKSSGNPVQDHIRQTRRRPAAIDPTPTPDDDVPLTTGQESSITFQDTEPGIVNSQESVEEESFNQEAASDVAEASDGQSSATVEQLDRLEELAASISAPAVEEVKMLRIRHRNISRRVYEEIQERLLRQQTQMDKAGV